MVLRTDPFRDLDRFASQLFGTAHRAGSIPMDAYRSGQEFVVHLDLPGVPADAIDLNVERNVLTVRAERTSPAPEGTELRVAERPQGVLRRQLFLSDTLDTERISADYDAGVLTLRIPVAERAKARKIEVAGNGDRRELN